MANPSAVTLGGMFESLISFEYDVKDVEKPQKPSRPSSKQGIEKKSGGPKAKLSSPLKKKKIAVVLKKDVSGPLNSTNIEEKSGGLETVSPLRKMLVKNGNPNIVSFSKFKPPKKDSDVQEPALSSANRKPVEPLEEPSIEPGSLLPPDKRQQYFESPALRCRIRFDRYRAHRIQYGADRPATAVSWNNSTILDRPDDFRKDMEYVSPKRMMNRSTRRRRELTGKAIQNYNQCITRPRMTKTELKEPWNRVTKPAYFHSALECQKGKRQRYAYGVKPKVYEGVAYTLDDEEQLCYNFERQVGRAPKQQKKVVIEKVENEDLKFVRTGHRLLPYQSAKRDSFLAEPRAGFVVPRVQSADKVKILKKVNLSGRKKHKMHRKDE